MKHKHAHASGKTERKKNNNSKRRKSKYGTEDLDLLWMEQGIALCLPVDFYDVLIFRIQLTHVVFFSFCNLF